MYREIATGIRAIGVADTELQKFENQFPLTTGVTYNSYIVGDNSEIAVIDSVDCRCGDIWLQAVEAAGEGRNVSYLVIQHMEPDHSSMIEQFLTRCPEVKIIATAAAIRMIGQFFPQLDLTGRTIAVKDSDTVSVGGHDLHFATAPMVHWPEVMVTVDTTAGVLFSADAFGSFGTEPDFNTLWPAEARRYYCNIVGKYGPSVRRLLTKYASLKDINLIAPLHGPVLENENISTAIDLYDHWSSYTPELPDGILIAYASIYGNTAKAALRLAEEMQIRGREVITVDLCSRDVSEAVAEAFRMGTLVLAASSYDAGLFPPMYHFIHHIQMKGLRGRRVALIENGSWAPSAAKVMRELVSAMPDTVILDPVVTIRSALSPDSEAALNTLADNL